MRAALAHSHPTTLGGGERAVLEVARGFRRRGHQVRLLLGAYEPARTYPELGRLPARAMRGRDFLLGRFDEDVAVANSFGASLLALRSGARVVVWVHSLRSRFLVDRRPLPGLVARRLLDRLAVRRARLLVANSAFSAERLRRLHGRPADAVVYPGVDLDAFSPRGSGGGYAVTVGRLAPEKGLERLFRLWPGGPLHVVGSGEPAYVDHLRRLAPPEVRFVGGLTGAALAQAYAGAAFAVFAPHAEELGLAALEAMACGRPVLAWREGGLAETVVDGEAGFLVDAPEAFAERARALAADSALRARLGAGARLRAEQFSWERTVDALEPLCARVAEVVPSPPPRARRA